MALTVGCDLPAGALTGWGSGGGATLEDVRIRTADGAVGKFTFAVRRWSAGRRGDWTTSSANCEGPICSVRVSAAGEYDLAVFGAGGGAGIGRRLATDSCGGGSPKTVELYVRALVRGRAVDAVSGAPLAGATVSQHLRGDIAARSAETPVESRSRRLHGGAQALRTGVFRLALIPGEPAEIAVDAEGYSRTWRSVERVGPGLLDIGDVPLRKLGAVPPR